LKAVLGEVRASLSEETVRGLKEIVAKFERDLERGVG